MWDAARSPAGDGLAGSGGPAASSVSRKPILDNGSYLLVNEAESTGGSGVFARLMQGVDQEVVSDLSATLSAMYWSRKRHVEDAGFNSIAGRRTAAIMRDNPEAVALRSVAVFQRLCDEASSDAAFQRLRLRRLNGVPGAANAASERVGALAMFSSTLHGADVRVACAADGGHSFTDNSIRPLQRCLQSTKSGFSYWS